MRPNHKWWMKFHGAIVPGFHCCLFLVNFSSIYISKIHKTMLTNLWHHLKMIKWCTVFTKHCVTTFNKNKMSSVKYSSWQHLKVFTTFNTLVGYVKNLDTYWYDIHIIIKKQVQQSLAPLWKLWIEELHVQYTKKMNTQES